MIFAIDSNIILYAEGVNDHARRDLANGLVNAVGRSNLLIPLQAIGECIRALTRRLPLNKLQAIAMVTPWFRDIKTQDTNRAVLEDAMILTSQHQFQFWDAVIFAAAKAGGASVLFSEDMQDGFTWHDVTILNPFSSTPNPLVTHLLNASLQ
jgi:predicted nucleic acid-binding protein